MYIPVYTISQRRMNRNQFFRSFKRGLHGGNGCRKGIRSGFKLISLGGNAIHSSSEPELLSVRPFSSEACCAGQPCPGSPLC